MCEKILSTTSFTKYTNKTISNKLPGIRRLLSGSSGRENLNQTAYNNNKNC